MNASFVKSLQLSALALTLSTAILPEAEAGIDGVSGSTFALEANTAYIDTFDGNGLLIWGYKATAPADPNMIFGPEVQYPGPTLIVTQGATVQINLTNNLPVSTSIVFPGQSGVTASGNCGAGDLTEEACSGGGTASYSFTASRAGTFLYHSGTDAELQSEMGLVGAIVVRPAGAPNQGYTPDTAFDHEYLSLVTQMDPAIHEAVLAGATTSADPTIDLSAYRPLYWFINGRNWPDTLAPSYTPIYPSQPYGSIPRTRPGEIVLMRVLNGGRATHPWHTHGHDAIIVARDGRLLSSTGTASDRSFRDFTVQVFPGSTIDYLFQWTGEKLGWDIYGDPNGADTAHTCNDGNADDFDDVTSEYCPDHGKPLPVIMPGLQTIGIGGFWSGSPFMGQDAPLPPGEGGLNLNSGYHIMWHSHNARDQVNNDEPPGGMTTMMVVEPPGTPIP